MMIQARCLFHGCLCTLLISTSEQDARTTMGGGTGILPVTGDRFTRSQVLPGNVLREVLPRGYYSF